jgi:DNA-directed RNA polymerase subunit RPC12/RpoP
VRDRIVIYRCNACGNKTRFDVIETKRVRSFHHFSLGGEVSVEDEEILERHVESVVCRWCGSRDVVEEKGLAAEEPA